MNVLELLAEPIRRYIYDKKWDSLRPIQESAIRYISTTQDNYILASKTASGKTEAAFLPVLSLVDWSQKGVQIVYISPLIALINDQFERVEELAAYLQLSITKWHGEAGLSQKKQLLQNPEGILLITPESIESLLANKPFEAKKLFQGTQFIIIDEIHSFLGTERGVQLQSLLYRLRLLNQVTTRYIGLSATLGDFIQPKLLFGDPEKTKILRDISQNQPAAAFYFYDSTTTEIPHELIESIYRATQQTKSLIFPNTRGRVEEIAVKLKKIATLKKGHQNYFAHHSSIERELREYIEQFAKTSRADNFSICCTSTLELGIDIGSIDQVIQVDSTHSVSSLVQRLGRSGRKNHSSKLLLYATNPWSLLQSVACFELYQEGYIEPIISLSAPFDVLFHQILSLLKQRSGMAPDSLIDLITKDPAFNLINHQEIHQLINSMLEKNYLQKIDHTLIIGWEAEKIVNSREFYSVFKTSSDLKVLYHSQIIGFLPDSPQLIAEQNIFLAARIWKILEVDKNKKQIQVEIAQDGKKPVFLGGSGRIHPQIRQKMRDLLREGKQISYLDPIGNQALKKLQDELQEILVSQEGRPMIMLPTKILWHTFTGSRINQTLYFILKNQFGKKVAFFDDSSHFELQLTEKEGKNFLVQLQTGLEQFDQILKKNLEKGDNFDFSKWGKYLDSEFKFKWLKASYFDLEATVEFLKQIQIVNSSNQN